LACTDTSFGVGKLMGRLHAQEGNQQEIIKREKWAHSITETPNLFGSFRAPPENKSASVRRLAHFSIFAVENQSPFGHLYIHESGG
jgi:hypothetical protein